MRRTHFPSSLIFFLAVVIGVQLLGFLFTEAAVREWYPTLIKPNWTPPAWLFGPVWTVLYLMMAVAAWMVWRSPKSPERTTSLYLFFIQLALNALWSCFFFTLHSPLLGLIDLSLLWIAIVFTTIFFSRVSPVAGILLIPYLLWSSYALVLNAVIHWMN